MELLIYYDDLTNICFYLSVVLFAAMVPHNDCFIHDIFAK